MNLRKFLFPILFLFICGCSTNLKYSPQFLESYSNEALQSDIKRGLRSQTSPYNVDSVEVDHEHFTTTKQVEKRHRVGLVVTASTTLPITETVYYDDIGRIELYSRRSRFLVLILQKNTNKLLYRFGTIDKAMATRFIDALHTISRNSTVKNN